MNKRLLLILFPLLALLAVFCARKDAFLAAFNSPSQTTGYSWSGGARVAARSVTVVQNKDTRKPNRNNVRIKADDDYAIACISSGFRIQMLVVYPSPLLFGEYNAVYYSGCQSSYLLRGPPVA